MSSHRDKGRARTHRSSKSQGLRITADLLLILPATLGFSAISAIAQPAQQGTSAAQEAGNAAHGKELFVKYACYQCHGYLGQGGTSAGVRIAPNPMLWQAIAAYIRKPTGTMPPFTSKLLPDRDVQDIYAYLKTVPAPVDLNRIPNFTK